MHRTRAWTITVVAVCGAVLMIVEFAGARMLEAHWGSSLIVWGSTIAVVLGGMAVGYTAGGRLADRRPGPRTLIALLLAAAATVLLGAFAGPGILDAVADVLPGPRAGSLTGALLTLAAPAAVLAAVSPVALHAVLTAGTVGRDAGRVYTAGTAGSVAGSLGAAFWLVELAGLRTLLAGCAAVLVACAAAGLLVGSERRAGWLLLIGGVPAIALASPALHAASSGASGVDVRASVETGEVSVQIVDDGPVRRLLFPGDLIQSEQDTRAPERLQLGYTHAIHGATCRAGALERVLLIGVGGGSLVRSMHRVAPGATIDAVELHRPVLELARRWFGLPAGPWVDYHVDDGRRFLGRTGERYDLIVLDAFGTERVPPHLLSREFMTLARDRLTAGGVLAANVIAAPGSELAEAVQATVADAFGSALVRAPVPATGNLVWAAPANAPQPGCETAQARALGLRSEAVHGAAVDVDGGRVLTDDQNPADSLSRE
jgi:spermidine synthase